MPASRYKIYKEFAEYKQKKDSRDMNSICKAPDGFRLQVQQSFLKEYITKYPDWRSLLLYHQIGSGKTCTAITLAEQYMSVHPNIKVSVILPARLRTNFIDELVSPCGMDKYISKEDFAKYFASETSDGTKKRIKQKFMKAIENKYDIMSYEKFKLSAFKTKDLKKWIEDITKNRLIIIDEVHNLIADKYDKDTFEYINKNHKIKRGKGINTILMKYLNLHAHSSCKMIYLTATPVFDNLLQFKELVGMMNPSAVIPKNTSITGVIDNLRGKVSFFPGTSANAYPKVEYDIHEIPFSKTQDKISNNIISRGQFAEDSEAFMIEQRMASIACLPGNPKISDNIEPIVNNQDEYSPKVKNLVQTIMDNRGKHVVYSTFIASGLRLVEAVLRKKGWVSIKDALKMKEENVSPEKYEYKTFALWDGSIPDAEKIVIKSTINKVDNLDGRHIRVILGSPSIKEGVSFKHIQHLHLLDPVWNSSAKDQIEGRAIRFCSHVDIPENHEYLKRKVIVHIYKSVPRKENPIVKVTCDQEIYDSIIPRKEQVIKAAEKALKKVAIDHFLFRKMYMNAQSPISPIGEDRNRPSVIDIPEDEDAPLRKNPKKQKGKTCPKKRRPNPQAENGKCPSDFPTVRKNTHGDWCCFKKDSKKKETNQEKGKTSTCPTARRPDNDGNCQDGFVMRLNSHGDPCCYKGRKESNKQDKTTNKENTEKTDEAAAKASCPSARRPDKDGKCQEGFSSRVNKYGIPCCYKETRERKKN